MRQATQWVEPRPLFALGDIVLVELPLDIDRDPRGLLGAGRFHESLGRDQATCGRSDGSIPLCSIRTRLAELYPRASDEALRGTGVSDQIRSRTDAAADLWSPACCFECRNLLSSMCSRGAPWSSFLCSTNVSVRCKWRAGGPRATPQRGLLSTTVCPFAHRDWFGTTRDEVCKPSYRLALVVLRFLFVSICIALKGIDDVHRTCASTKRFVSSAQTGNQQAQVSGHPPHAQDTASRAFLVLVAFGERSVSIRSDLLGVVLSADLSGLVLPLHVPAPFGLGLGPDPAVPGVWIFSLESVTGQCGSAMPS